MPSSTSGDCNNNSDAQQQQQQAGSSEHPMTGDSVAAAPSQPTRNNRQQRPVRSNRKRQAAATTTNNSGSSSTATTGTRYNKRRRAAVAPVVAEAPPNNSNATQSQVGSSSLTTTTTSTTAAGDDDDDVEVVDVDVTVAAAVDDGSAIGGGVSPASRDALTTARSRGRRNAIHPIILAANQPHELRSAVNPSMATTPPTTTAAAASSNTNRLSQLLQGSAIVMAPDIFDRRWYNDQQHRGGDTAVGAADEMVVVVDGSADASVQTNAPLSSAAAAGDSDQPVQQMEDVLAWADGTAAVSAVETVVTTETSGWTVPSQRQRRSRVNNNNIEQVQMLRRSERLVVQRERREAAERVQRAEQQRVRAQRQQEARARLEVFARARTGPTAAAAGAEDNAGANDMPTIMFGRTGRPVLITGYAALMQIFGSANAAELESLVFNIGTRRGLSPAEIDQCSTVYTFAAATQRPTADEAAIDGTGPTVVSSCTICLTDFVAADSVRSLKCSHDFHMHCIDRWLQSSPDCPLCRKDHSSADAGAAAAAAFGRAAAATATETASTSTAVQP